VQESKRLKGGATRAVRWAAGVIGLTMISTSWALAQATNPNAGALTLTGSVDVPSVYVFRGIVRETSPRLTLWPAGDIGLAIGNGLTANVGVWHSLHTGSSGSKGATGRVHYEEDFYAALGLSLGRGVSVGTTFTAYTSPNFLFPTVKELSVKVASTNTYAPYALVAVELSGAADQIDRGNGSYLEVGIGPSYGLGSKTTLNVPVKVGLSLSHYYQDFTRNPTFGFLSVGGLVAYPLGGPGKWGSWSVRGGADLYGFGDTTKAFNADKNGEARSSRIVARVGIGLTY
jgi:hypothetical protein